jgi:hypothetical protein
MGNKGNKFSSNEFSLNGQKVGKKERNKNEKDNYAIDQQS